MISSTVSPSSSLSRYCRLGRPPRKRIRWISESACFISSMDSSYSFFDSSDTPQFASILECRKYWLMAVSSFLRILLRNSIVLASVTREVTPPASPGCPPRPRPAPGLFLGMFRKPLSSRYGRRPGRDSSRRMQSLRESLFRSTYCKRRRSSRAPGRGQFSPDDLVANDCQYQNMPNSLRASAALFRRCRGSRQALGIVASEEHELPGEPHQAHKNDCPKRHFEPSEGCRDEQPRGAAQVPAGL